MRRRLLDNMTLYVFPKSVILKRENNTTFVMRFEFPFLVKG